MINGKNFWTLWSLIVQNCIVYKMVFRSECVIQMVLFDCYQPLFIDIDGDPYRQNELLIILGEESPDKYHKTIWLPITIDCISLRNDGLIQIKCTQRSQW